MQKTSIPVEIPHHEVLKLGGNAPVEAGPGQQPVRLPVRNPVCLMARLPLEVGVTERHADVVQEAGQRTQFDDGILRLGRQANCFCWRKSFTNGHFSAIEKAFFFLLPMSDRPPEKNLSLI